MINFIILFTGRTGSHFLVDTLNNHDNVFCRNEPSIIQLDWHFARTYWPDEVLATGFSYQFQEIDDASAKIKGTKRLRNYIEAEQIKVIHLYRENVVKHVLSGITGRILKQQIDKYHIYNKKDKIEQFYVDIEAFKWNMITKLEAERSLFVFLTDINAPILQCSYENLCIRNTYAIIDKIQNFLGVSHIETKNICSKQLKATPDNIENAVSNFEELKSEISVFGRSLLNDRLIFDKYFRKDG